MRGGEGTGILDRSVICLSFKSLTCNLLITKVIDCIRMIYFWKIITEFKARDINFMSDHIEFYLLPYLPQSALKIGRTVWLNEKVTFEFKQYQLTSIKARWWSYHKFIWIWKSASFSTVLFITQQENWIGEFKNYSTCGGIFASIHNESHKTSWFECQNSNVSRIKEFFNHAS